MWWTIYLFQFELIDYFESDYTYVILFCYRILFGSISTEPNESIYASVTLVFFYNFFSKLHNIIVQNLVVEKNNSARYMQVYREAARTVHKPIYIPNIETVCVWIH